MKKLACYIIALGIWSCSFAQQSYKRDIQYLPIKDSILIKQIALMNSLRGKKEKAYMAVRIEQYSIPSDTLLTYFLSPQYGNYTENDADVLYPDFYSFIDNQLVTIYIDALNRFSFFTKELSYKSKKKMRNLISRYIEKTKPVSFYDAAKGRKVKLTYSPISFGGRRIFIRRSKPPIIKDVAE